MLLKCRIFEKVLQKTNSKHKDLKNCNSYEELIKIKRKVWFLLEFADFKVSRNARELSLNLLSCNNPSPLYIITRLLLLKFSVENYSQKADWCYERVRFVLRTTHSMKTLLNYFHVCLFCKKSLAEQILKINVYIWRNKNFKLGQKRFLKSI